MDIFHTTTLKEYQANLSVNTEDEDADIIIQDEQIPTEYKSAWGNNGKFMGMYDIWVGNNGKYMGMYDICVGNNEGMHGHV